MVQSWETLEESCRSCQACPLGRTRQNLVFGVGPKDAEVMLIGEGPGAEEDAKGEPFVGRSGKLLDTMLAAVGLSRHRNVYIANMVKCRPPQNRDPLPGEQDMCIHWLRGQAALLRPRIVVCVGRVAACRLIDENFKVTRQHGQFFEKNGTLMMGTLHPAALLRDPGKKPEAFADWLALRDKIGEVCTHTQLWYE